MPLVALVAILLCLALAAPAGAAEWLAGDNHVHTCYSHDSWCPEEDPQQETLYSSFATVEQRFDEAAVKGLDYLVISDHDDISAQADPAFGKNGVLGIAAYEASINGHAHMLGATRLYPKGDQKNDPVGATNAMADALNADGGVFQANHPSYRAESAYADCGQTGILHWSYGFDVQPDTIEVWNPTQQLTPAEVYWECWLQRGVRIGLTGGSDTHGAQQPTIANPTTWVFAERLAQPEILAAIRAGRTTVSRLAPAQGGGRLLLEADGDGDGTFEAMVGDAVPPGSRVRITADGFAHPGRLRIRVNGESLPEQTIEPDAPLVFDAPAEPGWMRAVLFLQQETMGADPGCRQPFAAESPISLCATDLAVAAMTSPIYFELPAEAPADEEIDPRPSEPPATGAPVNDHRDEPDDDGPLAPAAQTPGGTSLQAVRGERVRQSSVRLRIARLRGGRRARLSWGPAGERFDVQVRRAGRWRTVVDDSRRRSAVVAARRGTAVRARIVRPFEAPGPWAVRRVRT